MPADSAPPRAPAPRSSVGLGEVDTGRVPDPRARDAERLARRVVIERVQPQIDNGQFPIKRTPGESVAVSADLLVDGHDVIRAVLRDRHVPASDGSGERGASAADEAAWRETPMARASVSDDTWTASFQVTDVGSHEYAIAAWVDPFLSWQRHIGIKAAAWQDVSLELLEGALLVREAASRADQTGASGTDAQWLLERADALCEPASTFQRVKLALADDLSALMAQYADRGRATLSPPLRVWVDRERARFGAWYEMFPRSAGSTPKRSGTLRDASRLLPAVADMGFDVLYLPPIHPIGRSFRKGANNRLIAGPDDPGSPWAIGSTAGGHTAVEPGLGSLEDFEHFRMEAERLGLEIALDLAWQCSPDHPWVREHPEWFRHRPDGTIRYAENPPKKYQDIYPLDFGNDDWRALWQALLDVTLFWVDRGVRIFRVDNPHTKTFGFWEWLIARVQERDPGVIFLSEAFTRPKVMRYLAKAGFTQSYTYFTWRNTQHELVEYFTELVTTEVREYLRPNLFTNTPDILHAYLQHGGRPAFHTRLLLAATLGANYGIYSGFELCENRAVRGTEEYANSEKYQYRQWDWDRPGHIKELIARVNRIRHAEPALQQDRTLAFHGTDNPNIIAYSKTAPTSGDVLFMAINLDPHYMQHGFVQVPFWSLGAAPDEELIALDLLTDIEYIWRREWNYVRFDPDVNQGHILKLSRRIR